MGQFKTTGERFIPGQKGQIELEHLNRYYFVIHQIDLKDKLVIDMASGEGYGSDLLAKHARQVIGIDIDEDSIEHARSKYIRSNLSYITGDITKIPLPDKSADVFVSFETIEHITEHEKMLSEIKRVLKDEGVCIISSPDKLNYSDIPGYNNEFHVKELYFSEFKTLLSTFFSNSIFFSQRLFFGSVIAIDECASLYRKPLVISKEGMPLDFTPLYNIAICSDFPGMLNTHHLVFYKGYDYIDSDSFIEFGKSLIRQSTAFRIGSFLLSPYSFINKMLQKIYYQTK